MNIDFDFTINAGHFLSAGVGLTGFAPTVLRYIQSRNIKPIKHTVFSAFNTCEQYIVSYEYAIKNKLRKESIQKWHRHANNCLFNFCLDIAQKSVYDLPNDSFRVHIYDRQNYYMELFRSYVFDEQNFNPIVREKFAVFTIDGGIMRIILDIKGYLDSPNISNKQKIWYILTDIEKYLSTVPNIMQKQAMINGELDRYEYEILRKLESE